MVLLDWPPPDHLGIGRKRGNSCQRKHPAAILAVGSSYPPTVAAQTRIVSAAEIRLDHRKSVRPFKGRSCNNISEFESYMPSHAVGSLWLQQGDDRRLGRPKRSGLTAVDDGPHRSRRRLSTGYDA